MPIPKDASKAEVFDDIRHGKTYARTRKKYGKKKANKQMITIALSHGRARKSRKRVTKRSRRTAKR